MRKTKIVCTLGPATESAEVLHAMIAAGANVFRLNMSHATHDWVRVIVPRIRAVAKEMNVIVGILMDTQGPAIRTGDLPTKVELKAGDVFEFTVRGGKSEELYSVDVNYDGLIDDISVGDTVLVDNGNIHMQVLAKDGIRIRCEVLTSGQMGSRRHINLPGVKVNLPPLTEKDLADVAVGAELHVDFVALSFCREPGDVEALRKVLSEHGSQARIVAKIEDQLAVKNIHEIIDITDMIMVARGDLGIECPFEELPVIQRRAIRACLARGRPVIVATHMLESMITQPVPTRAEITDVAHAVFEQADAVMLSGETTVGRYPVECVRMLDGIARRIERETAGEEGVGAAFTGERMKVLHAAVTLARQIPGARLVTFTRHGFMAQGLAALRPGAAPIIVFTPVVGLLRQLRLLRGVEPHLLELSADPNETVTSALAFLRRSGRAASGDKLVIATDIVAEDRRVDSVQLRTLA